MTYTVSSGTLNPTIPYHTFTFYLFVVTLQTVDVYVQKCGLVGTI